MRQDDHQDEDENNDEAQGIADIITDLALSESEDKKTRKSIFTTMTATIKALQDKIEAMEKGPSRKRNNNNKIYYWTHSRTRNNNHLSPICIKKKLAIKMMQPCPIANVVQTDFSTITDK